MNPNTLEPHPTGNFSLARLENNGCANRGKQPAMTDLNKQFPANTDAIYLQKDILK